MRPVTALFIRTLRDSATLSTYRFFHPGLPAGSAGGRETKTPLRHRCRAQNIVHPPPHVRDLNFHSLQESRRPFSGTRLLTGPVPWFSIYPGARDSPRGRSAALSSCLLNPWTLTQTGFRKKRRLLKPKIEILKTLLTATVKNAKEVGAPKLDSARP